MTADGIWQSLRRRFEKPRRGFAYASSLAVNPALRIAPVPFRGTAAAATAVMHEAAALMPALHAVETKEGYARFEAVTRVCRFVDDVEIFLDDREGLMHLCSASRIGLYDFGVNRRRLCAFREALGRILAARPEKGG